MPGWFRRAMAHAKTVSSRRIVNRPVGFEGIGASGLSRPRGATSEGAVVVTLTVTLVAEFASVTGFGETVQVASEGAPVHVKLTVPEMPPSPPTLSV